MRISYSVENIRRLAQVEPIEIRPITILVGRNSAGKSTFLRSLPLIRQSIETRSSAPILWYGDLVDFGDFRTSVSDVNESPTAIFSFKVDDLIGRHLSTISFNTNYLLRQRAREVSVTGLTVQYFVGADGKKTVLKKILLSIPSEKIDCEIKFCGESGDGGSVKVNGREVSYVSELFNIINDTNELFSAPNLTYKNKEKASNLRRSVPYDDVLTSELEKLLKNRVPRIKSEETFEFEVANILSTKYITKKYWTKLASDSNTKSFQKFYESMRLKVNSLTKNEVQTIVKTFRSLQVLDVLNDQLTSFFQGVSYIGPARAAGERYYRKQELEVSEILPNGSNLPMFLDSLSRHQKDSFSKWVESLFGYGVELKSFEGHISINLEANGKSVNVTDTGYGVSQILPVLASVWWAGQRPPKRYISRLRRKPNVKTIAIEQPELHLHPAHQAKLADVFAGRIKLEKIRRARVSAIRKMSSETERLNNEVNFIIETHSEALINRLGELIEKGTISEDDVQIVIFSAEDDINSPAQISLASFDAKGRITNWPYGFFNYS